MSMQKGTEQIEKRTVEKVGEKPEHQGNFSYITYCNIF